MTDWRLSHRADKAALPLADRHYTRQHVGSPQYVPPGRCLCLLHKNGNALWVSSFPYAKYVKHAWAGAVVNSMFRSEGQYTASDLILQAVALTRAYWYIPFQGLVSFVDPKKVPPTMRRGEAIYGYCYLKAGFTHVGYTKAGQWAWRMRLSQMPKADFSLFT